VAEVRLGLLGAVEGLPELRGAEEVEVARRISRGQGSVYRINGREARARDVQLLFADAGSGARSPAIVGPGPDRLRRREQAQERRRLLEDAAGIGGLHGRRREAEAKLAGTEANLRRVLDLLREQEARLAELERPGQAGATLPGGRGRAAARSSSSTSWPGTGTAGAAFRSAKEDETAAQAALDAATVVGVRLRRERGELAGRLPTLRDGLADLAARLATLTERRAQHAAALERAGAHRAALARQRDEIGADRPRAARPTRAGGRGAAAGRGGRRGGAELRTPLGLPAPRAADAARGRRWPRGGAHRTRWPSRRERRPPSATRGRCSSAREPAAELDAALAG
jgi:chromosome segregation protein